MPAHSINSITVFISILFTLFWLACYHFISDRQLHLTLLFLLLLDLSTRLLPSAISPLPRDNEFLSRDNEFLIKENSALSVTIKNMSDKHMLLCEIRNTLSRQRKDSKELITLIHKDSKELITLIHNHGSRLSPEDDMCLDHHTVAKHALSVGSKSDGCIIRPAASV